ncbi:MAG: hypothetical protein ABIO85_05965 [Sphingomicrobium sp.]
MKIVSPAGPMLCLMLLLAGCGSSSPVAQNAVAPPDNVVGDLPANGLAAPANAAAAETAQRAPLPVPSDGMHWHWDAARHAAIFGPSVSAPAFSIACNVGMIGVRRVDAAPEGGKGTISFTGNGRAASMPARAVGSGFASSWLAEAAPSDMTHAVAQVFAGPGPVEIALTGTAKLVTAPSPIPAQAFAACGS